MVRDNGELKGKINWFTIDQLKEKNLLKEDLFNPTEDQLQELKNRCVEHLKTEGFVFFDYIGYRVQLSKRVGKLLEFGVQFHHIK